MEPISPVMPGSESIEHVYGNHQKQYRPLPAICVDTDTLRIVVSRWRLSDEEREKVMSGGDIVLQLLIGKESALTPSHLQVSMPDEMPVLVDV